MKYNVDNFTDHRFAVEVKDADEVKTFEFLMKYPTPVEIMQAGTDPLKRLQKVTTLVASPYEDIKTVDDILNARGLEQVALVLVQELNGMDYGLEASLKKS